MFQNDVLDKYEQYEALYDPTWVEPHARPHKHKANQRPRQSRQEAIAALTDDVSDVDLGFQTTYKPSRYESGWLLSSLQSFYDEGLIVDVLAQVKGGKEASVYLVEAHPSTGLGLIAAKVYRPRMFRNLRNDAMYRRGREVLTADGSAAGKQASTIARAIRNKTAFGREAAHTSWLMHEFTAMETLYKAGAAVPQPIAANGNTVLMAYLGDELLAAPTLNTVRLAREEAEVLFREMVRNIDLLLQHELVHGDLSAFNILYWAGQITIIDFPQIVNLYTNPKARFILQRDVQRTCEYFQQQGVDCDAGALSAELWRRYVPELDPEDRAADESRLEQHLTELFGQAEL